MEPACLRHTELPHTSRLFIDFSYQYHRVEKFYTAPPRTGYPEDRRPQLIAALREQNDDHPSLDLLSRPGTSAVVTGQQVGLFSGPAYTIYKALTAVKLARDLEERGHAAVPVFWLATEDHDFAEVNHAWAFGKDNEPVRLRLTGINSDREPVGDIRIPSWPIDELRTCLAEFPFAGEVMSLVEQTYTPGATLGGAFRALLQRLLEPYGLLFIDPMHSSTRKLAAPMMRESVLAGPELNELVLQRNRELEAAGYHAQVHVEQRTSFLFVIENGKRIPLRELRYSADELAARAEDLSPNALLRPVMQDYMLPTAAYIGGPAEIAYFAQSQVLYERLLGHMPRVASRSGFTVLDSRTTKLMNRYGLHLRDFFGGEEALRERIAARLVPAGLSEQFESANDTTSRLLEDLRNSVGGFDPSLGAAVDKSRAKILHQLSKSRAKVAREMLRRDERARRDASYLYGALYPEKHLQERLYSILPFLARHGLDLVEQVYENVRLECPDHILLPV